MIAKLICFEVKGTYGAPEEVTYTDKNIVASVLWLENEKNAHNIQSCFPVPRSARQDVRP